MTLVEQFNQRIRRIETELYNVQRSADGWEFYGGSTASQIRNEVHNILVDLIQLRQIAARLAIEESPVN
jgi:hypothetical protein